MSDIPGDTGAKIITGGTLTISPETISGNCQFCTLYSHDAYNLLGKVVCLLCRDKIIKRFDLIMKFE